MRGSGRMGGMCVGPNQTSRSCRLRHGTKAIGLLAASSSTIDIGALDALAGVVAIAIERAQFLAERDAGSSFSRKPTGVRVARLAQPRLANAADRNQSRRREPARGTPGGRTARAVARGDLGAESLSRLVQDILDMARIDAAAIRVDRDWVTAEEVVDAAMAYVRPTLEGRPLRVNAAGDLEEIDPRLASGALSHILENAAQCSPAGREIAVNARVDHDGLHISVTDQGPGLDAGELEHLFERFYRGQSARQTTFGTGMGLSITRGLLAAAGGRVWAETCPAAERSSHS